MNQEQLQAIGERVNKATPGPWQVERKDGVVDGLNKYVDSGHDAEFVCHAREDVPALLDEIERLKRVLELNTELALNNIRAKGEIERLRGVLGWYGDRRNYRTSEYDEMDVSDAQLDGGERARQALAGEST